MVRFERKDTQKSRAAILSLEREKEKKENGSYNTPEVNAALAEMFHGKCYLCENKYGISSFQIEHLMAHQGNMDLKFDWNNLFWSCAHCNNTKKVHHEPIVDCSQVEVDKKIIFRKEGYFGTEETFIFIALEESEEIQNTVALLKDVYYGNTPQKKMETQNLRKELRDELSKFKNLVREYYEAEDYDKEDLKCAIRQKLGAGSPFAAFKRWLLWDHQERYKELLEACRLTEG